MSFTDQKPFVVEPEHVACSRGRALLEPKLGRICFFCGEPFQVGETVRWVYTNDQPGWVTGNPFIHCHICHHRGGDGERAELLARMHEHLDASKPFRWLMERPS